MRWSDGNHRLNGYGFEWTPGVGDGQGGLVCCGSQGCKELVTISHDFIGLEKMKRFLPSAHSDRTDLASLFLKIVLKI